MIPLRDVVPSRTAPVITVTLILANTLVFALELLLPVAERQYLVRQLGIVPAALAWPTLVTSMFLHGSWLHAIGNMWFLWLFGGNVEDRLGHGRYLLFYLLCGTAAGLVQAIADPSLAVPVVGASGAVAGVLGAYLALYPQSRVLTLLPLVVTVEIIEVPVLYFLGLWGLVQLFSEAGSIAHSAGAHDGLAFWAHLAGFAAGFAAVFVFRQPERLRVEWWND
jgi:membrane associated rhomboid family serine protease